MDDLIQELEQAQEGSRGLDARIAVEWLYLDCTDEAYVKLPSQYDTEARRGDYWLVQRSGKQLKAAPHYTTNLQDALGLVPEGWFTTHAEEGLPKWRWCLSTLGERKQRSISGKASTPALALTIASLRAMREKS